MTTQIQIGSRVVFHSKWPFHMHYGKVIGQEVVDVYKMDRPTDCWQVEWEGDLYFPERKGTVSFVPKYIGLNAFHAVSEGNFIGPEPIN